MEDFESGELSAPPRCVLVDDHPDVLDSLAALLGYKGIAVVGRAVTGAAALRELELHRPELAVVDVRLPDRSGFDVVREAARITPGTALVIHTAEVGPGIVERALEAGALGVVLKDVPSDKLLLAVTAALAGEVYIDPVFHGRQSGLAAMPASVKPPEPA